MQLSRLEPTESVGLEIERLEWLWQRYGPERGEIELGVAMEDLAALLYESVTAWEIADVSALRIRALAVQSVADRLGMALVAQVAGDVIALSNAGDQAALAATVARMLRVGERSLLAIWDAQEPI